MIVYEFIIQFVYFYIITLLYTLRNIKTLLLHFTTGATFLVWFGPTVRLTVSDPDLIREIFTSKSEFYEKNEAHPLIKQLEGDGLLSLKGEKWAHHRKIITPTFHMENLKVSSKFRNVLFFLFYSSIFPLSLIGSDED